MSVHAAANRKPMEFGFMMGVSPREPISRFGQLAALAEEVGFSQAWMADSQLYTKDPWIALALAGTMTKSIKLGPGVTNPVTRHITVTACTSAALNEVSNGRCVLGFGTGDASIYPLGMSVKVDELRLAVERLKAFFEGNKVEIDGRQIGVATTKGRIPIYIAASQPRMLRLAGAVADGVILMGAAQPELTKWQLEHVAAGAEEAGRTLSDVFVDLWFTLSLSDEERKAINDVRPWAASQARMFAKWKELPAGLDRFTADFKHAAEAYDFSRHLSRAGEPEPVSDDFVKWIGVAGPIEAAAEKIRPLLGLKVDCITFALLPGGREARIRQYGEELIPLLRKGAAR